MKWTYAFAIAATILIAQPASAASDLNFEKKMDRFVTDSIEALGVVPGFAICVVQGDKTVYIGTFGERDVEKHLPVTADTGFYIASATKSFTGMAASVLAGRGKFDLDAPVTRYLPTLELPDPLSADDITLRAMLTHRTGVNNRPVQKQLAFVDSLSRDEFLELMLIESKPMPTDFIYTNLGYNMMGYVIEEVMGQTWKQAVTETVIRPVGMTHTTTSIEDAARGNFAFPYTMKGDSYKAEKYKSDGMMHAAGGLVSTPADLARWLIVNLNQGDIDGRTVLSPDAVRAAHTQYATTDRKYDRFRRTGYGLGWYHSDFEGELLMHHFGGIGGYHAHVSFMPDHGVGVAAVINSDAYDSKKLTHMAAAYAYEVLLEHSGVDKKYDEELNQLATRSNAMKRFEDQKLDVMSLLKADETEAAAELQLRALQEGHEAGVVSGATINDIGYSLLGAGQIDPAIAVFQFNVEANPESANAHDSLGEAYEKAERLELAEESYSKAYELAQAQGDGNTELFKKNLDRVAAVIQRSRP
jgi:CubicO group peptidase (beta-lactamase class C family)